MRHVPPYGDAHDLPDRNVGALVAADENGRGVEEAVLEQDLLLLARGDVVFVDHRLVETHVGEHEGGAGILGEAHDLDLVAILHV